MTFSDKGQNIEWLSSDFRSKAGEKVRCIHKLDKDKLGSKLSWKKKHRGASIHCVGILLSFIFLRIKCPGRSLAVNTLQGLVLPLYLHTLTSFNPYFHPCHSFLQPPKLLYFSSHHTSLLLPFIHSTPFLQLSKISHKSPATVAGADCSLLCWLICFHTGKANQICQERSLSVNHTRGCQGRNRGEGCQPRFGNSEGYLGRQCLSRSGHICQIPAWLSSRKALLAGYGDVLSSRHKGTMTQPAICCQYATAVWPQPIMIHTERGSGYSYSCDSPHPHSHKLFFLDLKR